MKRGWSEVGKVSSRRPHSLRVRDIEQSKLLTTPSDASLRGPSFSVNLNFSLQQESGVNALVSMELPGSPQVTPISPPSQDMVSPPFPPSQVSSAPSSPLSSPSPPLLPPSPPSSPPHLPFLNDYEDLSYNFDELSTFDNLTGPNHSLSQLHKLFLSYSSPFDNSINPPNFHRFCCDICPFLPLDPLLPLLLSFLLNSSKYCHPTKAEFFTSLINLKATTLSALTKHLRKLREEYEDRLEDIYEYAFQCNKERPSHKVIKVEVAIEMMNLLIKDYTHTQTFIQFLKQTTCKVVSTDQWRMFFLFNKMVGPSFEGYSLDGAWPLLLDEFVEFMRSEMEKEQMLKNYGSTCGNNSHPKPLKQNEVMDVVEELLQIKLD